ncbi:MAG: hypothetical protein ACXWVT_14030 [Burkholderiaceae bacterium]
MALFDPKDLFKPLGSIAALAGSAALGFVAGYAVGRDPAAAKRLMQFVARGFDRASLAVAETREELGDLWAAARADARAQWVEAQFAEHEAAAAASAAVAAEPEETVSDERSKPAAKRARKTTAVKRTRRARVPVVH